MRTKAILFVLAALCLATHLSAQPTACAGGGTLDFTATSYDPTVPMTTFNVGQVVNLATVATGVTPTSFAWTIGGPHIKDYDERVGSVAEGGPISWSVTPMTAANLTASTVSFYWKLAGGGAPESNTVTLTIGTGSGPCTRSRTFTVERNTTDIAKQAEDFYTRNHRAPTETDLTKGRVIDDHIEWHTVGGSRVLSFLPWHHEFLDRLNRWRAEFGYPPLLNWYPGNPIPTGVEIDDTTASRNGSFNPNNASNRIPTRYTIAGAAGGLQKRLGDFASLSAFESNIEGGWHATIHNAVGGSGYFAQFTSPKDPLFFRWHGIIDRLYENFCSIKGLACANVSLSPSDLWMADNGSDTGSTPSSGTMWMSPSIWNRNVQATCTPASPVPTVARDCGSASDHQNPIAGVTNYLYATIRNDRPSAQQIKYLEVAVYIANASTGLSWPTSFGGDPDGVLVDSRQFLTLNVPAGQTTDIGPLPWVPPNPTPSDHWCLYVRARSEQSPIGFTEIANVDTNTRSSNNIIWRNVQIVVNSTDSATFTVANDDGVDAPTTLRIEVPDELLAKGTIRIIAPKSVFARPNARQKFDGFDDEHKPVRDPKLKGDIDRVVVPVVQGQTARERELVGRIGAAVRGAKACSAGQVLQTPASPPGRPVADVKPLNADRERELVETLARVERLQRACARSSPDLVARKLKSKTGTFEGLELKPGEKVPITIEFTSEIQQQQDFPVTVSQLRDGKVIGGNTYFVRTGTH